jgi:hypothetical protein
MPKDYHARRHPLRLWKAHGRALNALGVLAYTRAMSQQEASLLFVLGGLALTVFAGAAGLRLYGQKRRIEVELARYDREVPEAVRLYFRAALTGLHGMAALFGAATLLDLALASLRPSSEASATLGALACFGLGACGLCLLGCGVIDFRLKLLGPTLRLASPVAGIAGVALAVFGAWELVRHGYFWRPLA